jgi:hypothetical protein
MHWTLRTGDLGIEQTHILLSGTDLLKHFLIRSVVGPVRIKIQNQLGLCSWVHRDKTLV